MQSQKKISLFEKVNISHNKLDDKLLNKSDQNILITKKSPSPRGRIRAYKNKYNTPEISRLKQTDKNKVVLDIKQFKNKNDSLTNKNEEVLNNKIEYVQNSIETLNSQNISRKILLREKMFDINDIDEGIRLTDVNLANNKLNYTQNLGGDKNVDNFKQINDNHNFKEEKILRKSNSLNDFHLSNKQHLHIIDNFPKINREENYKLIKINFPKDNIIKSNSIEIIPGKFELLNSNYNNKNLIMTNSDKHIINQENIIINNGFVNMNNNYYVNNNNLNNNINKINDNNDFVNDNLNNIKFNNINYKNDIMYNTSNYYDSKIIDLNAINKHSNNLFNSNNYNNYNNSEKVYINPKFLTKLNEQQKYNLNYNNELNPIYKSKDISEEENSINETKEGNFNLEEDNFEPAFVSNNFPKGNKSSQFSNFNKKLINNFSRNENKFRLIPNPQYFHPSFHPNIPFQYISILQIQYPIQMMVKRSKKLQLVKNQLISYYPPKIQLEMRPCLIFQPLIPKKKKKQHKKIPNNKKSAHKKIKHKRPVFKIPPCKKVSLSQGKSLNFIHKYYDENFILEEEDEEENKALKDLLLTHKQTEVTNDFNNDNGNDENNNINEKEKETEFKEEKIDKVITDNNNIITNNEIKEKNIKEEKEKNESINNNENKKINEEKKIITKQRYINRMKIPINNDNLNKKNKGNKVILINIKKQKKSPIKEIMDRKKNINNIFSLNEVQQRFNILNNSTRLNSTSVSIEKSKDNTLTKKSKSKSKIANKKNDNTIKNINIISYFPRRKILQKSNSFFSKKIVKKIEPKKSSNNFDISYKSLSRKKIPEKNSPHLSQKNRIIKIDLSKL